jgi:hypothetical protein
MSLKVTVLFIKPYQIPVYKFFVKIVYSGYFRKNLWLVIDPLTSLKIYFFSVASLGVNKFLRDQKHFFLTFIIWVEEKDIKI